MRKSIKKILAFASAAAMACGALSLAACGTGFTPPKDIPDGNVASNGGFVVEKGDYYYFINGVESYDADNTYGTPVKGALMRVKKESGVWGKAETVIPNLMVTGSYDGGLFIYGDRVYYATPTSVKGIDGSVQNSYLDFVSAKLNGTDRKELVRVSSNSTPYRYVEEDGAVYLVYYNTSASALHSYNTAKGTDTVLAEGLAAAPVFHKTEKGSTTIYYTMTVTDRADSDHSKSYADFYNQIYSVEANATEAPYTYEWDQKWLDENNDGKAPYTNLGTLVLDGIGANQEKTKFNHSEATPEIPVGYTYTLRSFENGGIYFTRTETDMETVGAGAALYYLSEEKMNAQGWDSITGNKQLDCVANAVRTADEASASALYYHDNNGHHYLYVEGDGIFRADVDEKGEIAAKLQIAYDVSGATLKYLDPVEGNDEYAYVYYTLSVNSNNSVNRAVYDNKAHNVEQRFYSTLEDNTAPELKNNYAAVRILDLLHVSGWYDFEIIGTDLFFADADQTAYGSAMNVVSTFSLAGTSGLMGNAEIKALNEQYNKITGYDTTLGKDNLLADISEEQEEEILSSAVKYYFYTGTTELLDANVKEYDEAVDAGEDEDLENPYTEEILTAFKDFTEGKDLTYNGNTYTLKDGETLLNTRSAYVKKLGVLDEEDNASYENYWQRSVLSKYTAPAKEEKAGLAGWKIALIVIACVVAVAAVAAAVTVVLLKKKKTENEPKKPRMQVDTTDDRDIDVYADEEPKPEDELVETYEAPEEEAVPETFAAPEEATEEAAPDEEAAQEALPSEEGEAQPEAETSPEEGGPNEA